MTAVSGANLNLQWIYSGGTVVLSGDFTSVNYDPSITLHDASGGADADMTYVNGIKAGAFSFTAKHQESGTALLNSLSEGNAGTLLYSPEGTASGKILKTIPAIALGGKINQPYNNVIEISCDFTQNGARTDGSN